MKRPVGTLFVAAMCLPIACASGSEVANTFQVSLPPPPFAKALRPASPFGINTAFGPETPDLEARLKAMQQAGIKWGRQDFTWRRIDKAPGEYDWSGYDRLVELCRQHDFVPRRAFFAGGFQSVEILHFDFPSFIDLALRAFACRFR